MKLNHITVVLLGAGLLLPTGEGQAVEMTSAGCGTAETAIEKVAASFDQASGDITVDVHLCDPIDPLDKRDRSEYRVYFDYAAPFVMDTDRNADGKRDFQDFCVSTHELVIERRGGRKDSNELGEITPSADQATSVLTFQVNLGDLDVPSTTQQIFIWTDIYRNSVGGGAARYPKRDQSDTCPELGWKSALGITIEP